MLTESFLPQEDLVRKTFLCGQNTSSTYTTAGIAYPITLPQCSFVYMRTIAGGGAGGAGATAASGTGAVGGGGGGSSAISFVLIPRILLPDVIYVSVGGGGVPSGNAGENTYISIRPIVPGSTPAGADTIVYSNAGAGGSNSGSAGAAGAISTSANMLWGFGNSIGGLVITNLSIAGQAGAAGGVNTGAAGSAITYPTTGLFLSGGAGGAGKGTASTNFAGGAITGTANSHIPTIIGGTNAPTNGNSGVSSLGRIDLSRTTLFNISTALITGCGEATGTAAGTGNLINGWVNTGGAGGGSYGGSSGGTVSGTGGSGGFGSGGGGGGANITGGIGGAGGFGGPGLALIVCF